MRVRDLTNSSECCCSFFYKNGPTLQTFVSDETFIACAKSNKLPKFSSVVTFFFLHSVIPGREVMVLFRLWTGDTGVEILLPFDPFVCPVRKGDVLNFVFSLVEAMSNVFFCQSDPVCWRAAIDQ